MAQLHRSRSLPHVADNDKKAGLCEVCGGEDEAAGGGVDLEEDSGFANSIISNKSPVGDDSMMLDNRIFINLPAGADDDVLFMSHVDDDNNIEGDFASGGSGMCPSEPQSSAGNEEENSVASTTSSKRKLIGKRSSGGSSVVIRATPDQHSSVEQVVAVKQLVLSQIDKKLKDLKTLKQHYYPEGGWGYVVLAVTFLIHAVVVGMQLGLGGFVVSAVNIPAAGKDVVARRLVHGKEGKDPSKTIVLLQNLAPFTSNLILGAGKKWPILELGFDFSLVLLLLVASYVQLITP